MAAINGNTRKGYESVGRQYAAFCAAQGRAARPITGELLARWFGGSVGGDRIRSEWGIRSTLAYLAIRRLRWGYLTHGDDSNDGVNRTIRQENLDGWCLAVKCQLR